MRAASTRHQTVEACVEAVIQRVGRRIVLGAPLGLGKPNQLLNAFFRRAQADSSLNLTIMTALSLERPRGSSELERRFLKPFADRHFGDYPELDYLHALRQGEMPANIELIEFYFKSGGFLQVDQAQQNYLSSNYTMAARDILAHGINVLVQMVAKKDRPDGMHYSLSCNPDMTLDMVPLMRQAATPESPVVIVGQVNCNLPFMYRDAMVGPDYFDFMIDRRELDFKLFGIPNMPVSVADHMIGLYTSTLLKDGGTLQVGIGALGDAVVYSTALRHREHRRYRQVLEALAVPEKFSAIVKQASGVDGHRLGPFETGLFAASEMFSPGLLQLYEQGVIKRRVYQHAGLQRLLNERVISECITLDMLDALAGRGIINTRLTTADFEFLKRFGILRPERGYRAGRFLIAEADIPADLTDFAAREVIESRCLGGRLQGGMLVHAAFFLGSSAFYERLRAMDEAESSLFSMGRVSEINQLYGDEVLGTLQRRDARFLNTCMKMTLTGGAVSDGLANGQVVSGVGGQYNFVAMAHALPDARSILMLRATRHGRRGLESNIVFNYGHITIPRHLRDIVVTEYGIADLRARTDKNIIAELLNIADSRFQNELMKQAQQAGKLPHDHLIPAAFRKNTPAELKDRLGRFQAADLFPDFPLGTDFTPEEAALTEALGDLKRRSSTFQGRLSLAGSLLRPLPAGEQAEPYLARLELAEACGIKARVLRRLVAAALARTGVTGAESA